MKANNLFKYTGELVIKTRRKTTRLYNSGTFQLFELFIRALLDDTIEINLKPKYIDIRDSGNKSILNNPILITKQLKIHPTYGCTCVITGAVKLSNLNSIAAKTGTYNVCLLANNSPANNEKNILATLQMQASTLNNIISGKQALLEWTLYVNNSSQED